MTLNDLLLARITPLPQHLPAALTSLRIEVAFTPEAIRRGVPAQVIEGVDARLQDAAPLFRAGFAASSFGLGGRAEFAVRVPSGGYVITASGIDHSPLQLQILLRLIVAENQTPPGAYQRLLAALDGDEQAARDAFFPLDFLKDVAAVTVSADGDGAAVFTMDPPALRDDLTSLAARISTDGEAQSFSLPQGTSLDEAVENGFLSLQNAGIFRTDVASTGPEPELFLQNDAGTALIVDGWSDDPAYLAEMLWVLARGQTGSIQLLDAG